jgi:hypothetical protein
MGASSVTTTHPRTVASVLTGLSIAGVRSRKTNKENEMKERIAFFVWGFCAGVPTGFLVLAWWLASAH